MTISTKLKKVLFRLSNLYFPFNNLSPERLQEIVNHIRIIELNRDEVLQLRGAASQDYLYLMEGEIELVCNGNTRTISNPDETQRNPILLPSNSSCSIIANSDCIVSHAGRELLDTIIAWDHISNETHQGVNYIDMIRNTLVFQRLPMQYIKSAFSRMKPCYFKQGESIPAEQCDAYYLILSGKAEVQKLDEQSQCFKHYTELGIGDIFGDEAQLASKKTNETIVMLEDSELLILGKKDYQELISRPIVRTVQAQVARTMIDNGYQLLNVSFPEEYAENRIPGSQLIPLCELNHRLSELDQNRPYIIYCHSGPRSAVAALILQENNFEAMSLEGGIRDWPFETEQSSIKPNIVSIKRKFH